MAILKLRVKNFSKSPVRLEIEGCDPKKAQQNLAGEVTDKGVVVVLESAAIEPGNEKELTLLGFAYGPKELWWNTTEVCLSKGLYLYEFSWLGPSGRTPLAHPGFLGVPTNLLTETRVELPKGDQVANLQKASDFFREEK